MCVSVFGGLAEGGGEGREWGGWEGGRVGESKGVGLEGGIFSSAMKNKFNIIIMHMHPYTGGSLYVHV